MRSHLTRRQLIAGVASASVVAGTAVAVPVPSELTEAADRYLDLMERTIACEAAWVDESQSVDLIDPSDLIDETASAEWTCINTMEAAGVAIFRHRGHTFVNSCAAIHDEWGNVGLTCCAIPDDRPSRHS